MPTTSDREACRDLGNIGNVALSTVTIPSAGCTRYGVSVVAGHTYVSLAQEGEEGHYIVFRVTSLQSDTSSVTIDYIYTPDLIVVVTLEVAVSPTVSMVNSGEAVILTASASGGTLPLPTSGMGTALTGETSSTFSAAKTVAGTYTFSCKVTDSTSHTATSNTATITVNPLDSPTPTPTSLSDYWVTVTAGEGGTISGGSGFTTPGTSYTYTITPNEGYQILDVTDNNVSKGAIPTYQLTNIHENHEIIATFSPTSTTTTTSTSTPPANPENRDLTVYYVIAGVLIFVVLLGGAFAFRRTRKSSSPSSPSPTQKPTKPPSPPPSSPQLRKPSHIKVTANPVSIVADGSSKSALTVQLLDDKDVPVVASSDVVVELFAAKGKLDRLKIAIPG